MKDILLGPGQASTLAPTYDTLFYALLGLTGLVTVIVFFLIIYFCAKYRDGSPADRVQSVEMQRKPQNRPLEYTWAAIPLALFIGVFVWSAWIYVGESTAPANAIPVYIVAKQWMWKLEHTNGVREINELHVPRGFPVKLIMTSQDVIHSFFVPAFRIKQDVLPGRYVTLWFQATKAGEFHLFCAEYCGTDHSQMVGRIVVMEPADYEKWLGQGAGNTMAQRGEIRFREFGCAGCHGAGSTVRAPDLSGIFGKPIPLQGGGTVLADERYLRDSILLPNKEIVAGYPAIMPSYTGQIGEEELIELSAYIASLDGKEKQP